MRNLSLSCLLVAATPLVAQLPTGVRPVSEIGTWGQQTANVSWNSYKLASPNVVLPARPGLDATANLVYATYADVDASGFVPQVMFRRSTDGGYSWGPPQVLHTLASGERWYAQNTALFADGDDVFLVVRDSEQDPASGSVGLQLYVSQDQGRTWNHTLLSVGFAGPNPTLEHLFMPSAPRFWCAFTPAAKGGRGIVHCVYEALYTGAGVGTGEEMFYASGTIDRTGNAQVIFSDVRLTDGWGAGNPNGFDCDDPRIVAEGTTVAVTWLDDRNSTTGNAGNDLWCRVSRDAGITWQPEVDMTMGTALDISTAREARAAAISAAAGTVTVGWLEEPAGPDLPYAAVLDLGNNTLVYPRAVMSRQTSNDADTMNLVADETGKVDFWYNDDRNGGNSANHWYVLRGTNGGRDLADPNLTPEFDLTSALGASTWAGASTVDTLYWRGGRYVMWGESRNPKEAAVALISLDQGATWQGFTFSNGNNDVDDPTGCVTANGDVPIIYIEDLTGSNNGNHTFIGGVKMPLLTDETAMGQGFLLSNALGSTNAMALLAVSATGTKPALALDNLGFAPNLAVDAVTAAAAGVLNVFGSPVDSQGFARFSLAQNWAQQTGVDLWYCVLTFDLSNPNSPWLEFSDPVLQSK